MVKRENYPAYMAAARRGGMAPYLPPIRPRPQRSSPPDYGTPLERVPGGAMLAPIVVDVMVRTVSEANSREHHFAKAKRAKALRGAALATMSAAAEGPAALLWWPLRIELSRVAPRELDDDNLRGSMKAIRDGVADWLGLESDRDPRVRWAYDQAYAGPKIYAVRVKVEALP